MTRNWKHIAAWTACAAFALLAGSCSKSGDNEPGEAAPGEIRLQAATGSGPISQWIADGEQMGFYLVSKAKPGDEALAGARLFSNVVFTKNGDQFTTTPAISFPEDRSLVYDAYAYFPYRAQALADGGTTLEVTAAADQSTAGAYASSDLLFAKTLNCQASSKNPIALEFGHALSKISIVLKAGAGYAGVSDIETPCTATVLGVGTKATLSFLTGQCSPAETPADVTPYGTFAEKEGTLAGVSAVVVPQTIAARTRLLKIRTGAETYYYAPDEDLVLEAGKDNTITLTLNASFDGVAMTTEVTVTDWTSAGSFDAAGSEVLPPTEPTVKDADGNEYDIIRIGRQYWMGQNLRTTKLNDGTPIEAITDAKAWHDAQTAARCSYDNDPANTDLYGELYNYACVKTRKLCPEGWHVPTGEDWDRLGATLGGTLNDWDAWVGVAPAMKATSGWPAGEAATNESLFGAVPGGYRWVNEELASFHFAGDKGYWWSDNDMSGFMSYVRSLQTGNNDLAEYTQDNGNGVSVRCIHDF